MSCQRFGSLSEALDYLFSHINYERTRSIPYRSPQFRFATLEALLGELGHPHWELPVVHVAGTKGKGSTCAMLSSVLAAAGYRVGRFTSPHLEYLGERFCINDRPCPPEKLVELTNQVAQAAQKVAQRRELLRPRPTFFELVTALGFLYFAQEQVDLAVVEVGLGGRLDCTNVCRPRVCVITSISLDHMAQLGNTVEQIATEKAGILKPGVPVVSGVRNPQAQKVIAQRAKELECPMWQLGREFEVRWEQTQLAHCGWQTQLRFWGKQPPLDKWQLSAQLPLPGAHQVDNAAVAIAVVGLLGEQHWPVSPKVLQHGLAQVHWPARMELLSTRPLIVLDSAHNAASVQALVQTLAQCTQSVKRWLVFGTSVDKDIAGMIQSLGGFFDHVVLTRFDNPRSANPEQLQVAFAQRGVRAQVFGDPIQALRHTLAQAGPEDLVCVCGSLFLAAQVRPWLRAQVAKPRSLSPQSASVL